MKICLIGAMNSETAALKGLLENARTDTVAGLTFAVGTMFGHEVSVVTCGVGKVNSALCAQAAILTYRPDLVVNVGVAGGVAPGIRTGDVVLATRTVQYDFDLSLIDHCPVGLVSPCDGEISEKLYETAKKLFADIGVYHGTVATGDRFVADGAFSLSLHKEFDAYACEMEGGSIAQVCAQNGVKCAVVRAISDNANEQSETAFEIFLPKAVDNTVALMTAFLRALNV